MGYVVVGQTAQASTRVCNYGCRNAQVRLSKSKKSEDLAKLGIKINYRDQTSLMPGEYVNLEVTLNPTRLKSSEKSSTIMGKFYLEVNEFQVCNNNERSIFINIFRRSNKKMVYIIRIKTSSSV